jgi:hypothetical protein
VLAAPNRNPCRDSDAPAAARAFQNIDGEDAPKKLGPGAGLERTSALLRSTGAHSYEPEIL